MADIIVDGKTKVTFVATLASTTAPSAATITAGTDLTDTLTADGLVGFAPDTASVDNTSLGSTFNTVLAGRTSYSGTMLRLKKQTGTDTIYDLLVRDLTGYIVVRRGITKATAYAAAQKVQVYPIICGEVKDIDPEPNSVQRYEIPLFISSEPNLRATTAA